MAEAVIVSAVRTPTGKFLGGLKEFTATQLGGLVVAEAVRRSNSFDDVAIERHVLLTVRRYRGT